MFNRKLKAEVAALRSVVESLQRCDTYHSERIANLRELVHESNLTQIERWGKLDGRVAKLESPPDREPAEPGDYVIGLDLAPGADMATGVAMVRQQDGALFIVAEFKVVHDEIIVDVSNEYVGYTPLLNAIQEAVCR